MNHGSRYRIDFPAADRLDRSFVDGLPGIEFRWWEPLARHTTFRVGGPVWCLARPRDEDALESLMKRVRERSIPCVVLGGGSNVLAPDEPWEVLAVQLNLACSGLVVEDLEGGGVQVHAGAGVGLSRLLRCCLRSGLGGLEFLVGIPGSIGGALVMNAGTRDGCMHDVLEWVELMDRGGRRRRLNVSEIPGGYRSMGLPEGWIVLRACLNLRRTPVARSKAAMRDIMKKRRSGQPVECASAGCVFKNPPSLSAGELIDRAGLKGFRVGDAEVSTKHANWIINRGRATASDILCLIRHIEGEVFRMFGVSLEREIRVLESQPGA